MVTWRERYREWRLLFEWACENREELERRGRMRMVVFCLQRHWGDMNRLREKGVSGMKCTRCGNEFENPGFETNICGNCADDLRQEEVAYHASEEAAYNVQDQLDKALPHLELCGAFADALMATAAERNQMVKEWEAAFRALGGDPGREADSYITDMEFIEIVDLRDFRRRSFDACLRKARHTVEKIEGRI